MKRKKSNDATTLLAPLRQHIDSVDNQLIELLNERAALAQQIGAIKAKTSMRAYVPERERQVIDRLVARSQGPLKEESLRLIYKEIISASLALESPLQVAFLGPEATLAHAASKRHFGLSARLRSVDTVADVFAEVERNRCDYGVVPIENTLAGIAHHTLDMFVGSDLQIGAEVLLRVTQHLLSRSGELDRVSKVYVHPDSLAACRSWLDANLPGISMVQIPSIAHGAQLAADDPSAAVIASDVAASLYGLITVAHNLEDSSGNYSRFLVIGHDTPPPSQRDRTSLMFTMKDMPGILYSALQPFARGQVNMTRIESRPSRRRHGDYLFYVDLEGHKSTPEVALAIEELAGTCVFLKVLGSYPQGKIDGRPKSRHTNDGKEI